MLRIINYLQSQQLVYWNRGRLLHMLSTVFAFTENGMIPRNFDNFPWGNFFLNFQENLKTWILHNMLNASHFFSKNAMNVD